MKNQIIANDKDYTSSGWWRNIHGQPLETSESKRIQVTQRQMSHAKNIVNINYLYNGSYDQEQLKNIIGRAVLEGDLASAISKRNQKLSEVEEKAISQIPYDFSGQFFCGAQLRASLREVPIFGEWINILLKPLYPDPVDLSQTEENYKNIINKFLRGGQLDQSERNVVNGSIFDAIAFSLGLPEQRHRETQEKLKDVDKNIAPLIAEIKISWEEIKKAKADQQKKEQLIKDLKLKQEAALLFVRFTSIALKYSGDPELVSLSRDVAVVGSLVVTTVFAGAFFASGAILAAPFAIICASNFASLIEWYNEQPESSPMLPLFRQLQGEVQSLRKEMGEKFRLVNTKLDKILGDLATIKVQAAVVLTKLEMNEGESRLEELNFFVNQCNKPVPNQAADRRQLFRNQLEAIYNFIVNTSASAKYTGIWTLREPTDDSRLSHFKPLAENSIFLCLGLITKERISNPSLVYYGIYRYLKLISQIEESDSEYYFNCLDEFKSSAKKFQKILQNYQESLERALKTDFKKPWDESRKKLLYLISLRLQDFLPFIVKGRNSAGSDIPMSLEDFICRDRESPKLERLNSEDWRKFREEYSGRSKSTLTISFRTAGLFPENSLYYTSSASSYCLIHEFKENVCDELYFLGYDDFLEEINNPVKFAIALGLIEKLPRDKRVDINIDGTQHCYYIATVIKGKYHGMSFEVFAIRFKDNVIIEKWNWRDRVLGEEFGKPETIFDVLSTVIYEYIKSDFKIKLINQLANQLEHDSSLGVRLHEVAGEFGLADLTFRLAKQLKSITHGSSDAPLFDETSGVFGKEGVLDTIREVLFIPPSEYKSEIAAIKDPANHSFIRLVDDRIKKRMDLFDQLHAFASDSVKADQVTDTEMDYANNQLSSVIGLSDSWRNVRKRISQMTYGTIYTLSNAGLLFCENQFSLLAFNYSNLVRIQKNYPAFPFIAYTGLFTVNHLLSSSLARYLVLSLSTGLYKQFDYLLYLRNTFRSAHSELSSMRISKKLKDMRDNVLSIPESPYVKKFFSVGLSNQLRLDQFFHIFYYSTIAGSLFTTMTKELAPNSKPLESGCEAVVGGIIHGFATIIGESASRVINNYQPALFGAYPKLFNRVNVGSFISSLIAGAGFFMLRDGISAKFKIGLCSSLFSAIISSSLIASTDVSHLSLRR